MIFDYNRQTLYLRKSKGYKDKFKFNSAGINVLATGDELNSYFVADLIKDSPAEKAGLIAGDEIIAIDGKPAIFYSLSLR